MTIDYERINDDLIHKVKLKTSKTLIFSARSVRRERTGIHARISISIKDLVLAWSLFNIDRDEDRTRLTNAAFKGLSQKDAEAFPKEILKHELDNFCSGLWDAIIKSFMPEEMSGAEKLIGAKYVLNPFVVHGGGTVVFAPPGSGKSWWAFLAAVSVDAGLDTLWPVIPAKTMIINLERSKLSTQQRLGAVNLALGLPQNRKILMLNARGQSLRNVLESVARAVEEYAVDFVVLDSISRTGMGKMVADDDVNAIMDTMNGICPTWLALGHSPRADATHMFGSVMFDAAADIVARLICQEKRDEDVLGVGVEIYKANDVPKAPMDIIKLSFNGTGLVGVHRAHMFEFSELNANRKMSMTEEVESYLENIGSADATTIAKELGRNRANISRLLSSSDKFIVVKRDKHKVSYGVKAI